jgi:hypothetical protein
MGELKTYLGRLEIHIVVSYLEKHRDKIYERYVVSTVGLATTRKECYLRDCEYIKESEVGCQREKNSHVRFRTSHHEFHSYTEQTSGL